MTSHLLHFQTTKKLTQGYCYTRRIPANQAWKFCLFAKLTQMLLQYQSLCLNRWIYQSLISNWNKQASKTYRNTAALGLERLKYLPLFHAFVVYNHFSFFSRERKKSCMVYWNHFRKLIIAFSQKLEDITNHSASA